MCARVLIGGADDEFVCPAREAIDAAAALRSRVHVTRLMILRHGDEAVNDRTPPRRHPRASPHRTRQDARYANPR